MTAKQCYHCQGLGHVQADCPTLRLSGASTSGRCYSCGLTGHLARNCPNPGAGGMGRGAPPARGGFGGGFRGGFAGGPRPATCYKCGGPNHFARDCQAQAMKCYACGKLGKCFLLHFPVKETNRGRTHLARLHCSQWRPAQHCRQDLLPLRRDRSHLP
jgi:cellular nucleic acid-binding protein